MNDPNVFEIMANSPAGLILGVLMLFALGVVLGVIYCIYDDLKQRFRAWRKR